SLKNNNHKLLLKTYLIITDILLEQHKYKEAEKYIRKALALINYPDNISQKAQLLKKAADIYHILGDDTKSYNYLKQYSQYADSIINSQLISILSEFENEVHKSSLKTVKRDLVSEQEKSTFYLYAVIFGILLFSILSILLYLILKKSSELKNSLIRINEQNTIIGKQYEEILQQNKMLERYKNDLEELVNEQTFDLIEAKEQAEHADRLKTSFLENLSHEVRTPLNAITGFAEVLQYEENLSENVKTYIDHINTAGESLLRIIDSIIQLSDIQSSDYRLSTSTFLAVEPIYKIVREFKNTNEFRTSKNVEIKAQINIEPEQKISTDENALNAILYHLTDNSIKFTEKGYVEVGVSPFDENQLLYYVKDTGIGIHQEDIKFIFDRFRKANSDTKKLYRGLGMGLTIVKNLIECMGGEIWLDTETQKGSMFYFSIPILYKEKHQSTKS
ncbi:MAG: ATP-binding protein, partial [Bacteroidales bacterium]|nr:ATP-binding protein [Bacteroidales bacterium]